MKKSYEGTVVFLDLDKVVVRKLPLELISQKGTLRAIASLQRYCAVRKHKCGTGKAQD